MVIISFATEGDSYHHFALMEKCIRLKTFLHGSLFERSILKVHEFVLIKINFRHIDCDALFSTHHVILIAL